MLVALVAFAPSLLLLYFFYSADRYEPEPRSHVLAAVVLGALAMVPAVWAERSLASLGSDLLAAGDLRARAYEAFVIEGLTEELCKWLVLAGIVYRWREFDEPLDGVIYGVAVALGFGTVENALYVAREGLGVGLLRAVFAVPEHALLGATMGGFLGAAKLVAAAATRRARRIVVALALPALLHGLYDLLLLELVGPPMYATVAVGSLALWIYVLRRVRHARNASPFRPR